MEELNKNTLKEALKKLPTYEPPELLWEQVNKDLNQVMPRTALQAAIQALPEYNPPDFVWEHIQKNLELGEVSLPLETAIETLPEYEPPQKVWNKIEDDLMAEESEATLQTAIQSLPEYEPTDSLWDSIEAALPKEKPQGKIVVFRTWKRFAAAAAMVGVVLTATWGFFNYQATANNYAYSQELIDEQTLSVEWEADEQDFQTILAVCLERKYVCEQPKFLDLKSELQELNEAKDELKTVLERYGKDPKLIQQLTKIEHQRSDVLKKMVVLI